MDPKEYEIMYGVEDHHWWYRGMEAITRSLLNCWYAPNGKLSILDAGCGTGAALTSYLTDYGRVTGIDLSSIALAFCHRRNAPRLVQASVTDLPFAAKSFDLVTSFDVLYERGVDDDAGSLSEFARVLVQGGRALLRLPAYNWLRGQHDIGIHTARRYTAGEVKTMLKRNGFLPERISYANTLMFPAALVKRMVERIWPPQVGESDLAMNTGVFNQVLQNVLAFEAPLVSQVGLPFGLSVIAVGKKE